MSTSEKTLIHAGYTITVLSTEGSSSGSYVHEDTPGEVKFFDLESWADSADRLGLGEYTQEVPYQRGETLPVAVAAALLREDIFVSAETVYPTGSRGSTRPDVTILSDDAVLAPTLLRIDLDPDALHILRLDCGVQRIDGERPARCEMHQREGDQRDADDERHRLQEAAEDEADHAPTSDMGTK